MSINYNNIIDTEAITLNESLSTDVELAISAPINGKQSIRTDIKPKSSLMNHSIVRSKHGNYATALPSTINKIFNEEHSGVFLKISSTKSKEGGESSNPMFLVSTTFVGG